MQKGFCRIHRDFADSEGFCRNESAASNGSAPRMYNWSTPFQKGSCFSAAGCLSPKTITSFRLALSNSKHNRELFEHDFPHNIIALRTKLTRSCRARQRAPQALLWMFEHAERSRVCCVLIKSEVVLVIRTSKSCGVPLQRGTDTRIFGVYQQNHPGSYFFQERYITYPRA